MSTLPNLLGWFFPQQQAESHRTSGLLAEPQNIFANYRHGRAIVESLILPGQGGRVWFKGSWWPARCPLGVTLCQGQAVRVIDIERITLIVEPITEATPASPSTSPTAPPTSPTLPPISPPASPPAFTLTLPLEPALDPGLGARATPLKAPVNTPANGSVNAPAYPVGYASQSARLGK